MAPTLLSAGGLSGGLVDDRRAALFDARDQPVERVHERVDAVGQQLLGDCVHVDAGAGQRGERRSWVFIDRDA